MKDDSVEEGGTIQACVRLTSPPRTTLPVSFSLTHTPLNATFGESVTTSKHNHILLSYMNFFSQLCEQEMTINWLRVQILPHLNQAVTPGEFASTIKPFQTSWQREAKHLSSHLNKSEAVDKWSLIQA